MGVDVEVWERAPYQPTPTIVQAAQALYAQHSVEAISRSDAGAKNLQVTSRRIDEIVEEAKGIPRWEVEGGRWKEFVNVKVNGEIRLR